MQGWVSVVMITPEITNDDHEMGQEKVSNGNPCNLLKLIYLKDKPQGSLSM